MSERASDDWPLTGRDAVLATVRAVLRRSGAHGVVLAGAAGVGKSRLAREIAQRAGGTVRWVHATGAARGMPFGAVAHLLPDAQGGVADRAQLLSRVARELVASAGEGRLVLVVDDAHLLDDAPGALVHLLATTTTAFLVVTLRTGEPVPETVTGLWKDGMLVRLDIPELDRNAVEDLLDVALDGPADVGTRHEIWRLTRGNAQLLRELVHGAVDAGVLRRRDGTLRWSGPLPASPRLAELVAERMGRLRPTDRSLLELLAFGEPLTPSELARAGHGDLTALEARGLVRSTVTAGRVEVRLAHPLHAEVLRAGIPPLASREIHRTLAGAVLPQEAATDELRAVTWRLAADLPVPAGALARAGGLALLAGDYALAERLARSQEPGLAAGTLLGQALLGQGRGTEAEDVLAPLVGLATADEERTRLAIIRAGNLFWGLDDEVAATAVVDAAEPTVADPSRRRQLAAVRAGFVLYGGSTLDALAILEPLLADQDLDGPALVQALTSATVALTRAGRCDEGIAAAERGLALVARLPDAGNPWNELQLQAGLLGGHVWAGRLAELDALATEMQRRATEERRPIGFAVAGIVLGEAMRIAGRPLRALDRVADAATAARFAPVFFRITIDAVACGAAALLGDAPAAEAACARAAAGLSPRSYLFEPWTALARCWVAQARGEVHSAVELALEADAVAARRGQALFRVMALYEAVRMGRADLVHEDLTRLAAASPSRLSRAFAAHGAAQSRSDGAALDAAAAEFAALGTALYSAEASADAARAYRLAGRGASAIAAATRSRHRAERCEGAWTWGLRMLPDEPGSALTRRELEIANLAAAGLTSREIAGRLVLSVRTVDNVLHQVYAKLGLAGRGELMAALGRRSE